MESIPFELWVFIVGLCGAGDRAALKRVSRLFYAASTECQRNRLMEIKSGFEAASFDYRRYVTAVSNGTPDLWARMSAAMDLQAAEWVFPSAVHLDVSSPHNTPIGFFAAIPATLRSLRITAVNSFGVFMLGSLCASLPRAWALQGLTLVGFCAAELAHVINALAVRARSGLSHMLRHLEAKLTRTPTCLWPQQIDISGLTHVMHLDVQIDAHASLPDLIGLQTIVEHTLAANCAQMETFVYHGAALSDARAWTAMVHRSSMSLRSLVMPPFPVTTPPAEVEMAVDTAACIEELVINWQSARLDFMLRNKPRLRKLHHYGGVVSDQCLATQLGAIHTIREFYLAAELGAQFATFLADCTVHWPECNALYLGGVDANVMAGVFAAIRAGASVI